MTGWQSIVGMVFVVMAYRSAILAARDEEPMWRSLVAGFFAYGAFGVWGVFSSPFLELPIWQHANNEDYDLWPMGVFVTLWIFFYLAIRFWIRKKGNADD